MGEAGSAIRVLHVDDDRQYAETTAAFLKRERVAFDIEIATSARKGLRLLETAAVDCIVSESTDGSGATSSNRRFSGSRRSC